MSLRSATLPLWRQAQPRTASAPLLNALTVDVEDYFQVSAFEGLVDRALWGRYQSRVVGSTGKILDIMARAGVQGTFFVLGWIAHQHPQLVRTIQRAGHEIACHGYWHRLIYQQSPAEFRADLRRARAVLEDIAGTAVHAYRAPSFSITRRSLWALDILIEEGFRIDSSIYPTLHDRYGMGDAPCWPHRIVRPAGEILEFPLPVYRRLGFPLPVGGGGYLRLFPYTFTRHALRTINHQGRPFALYVHPWEVDPEQPRLVSGPFRAFRHYVNLRKTAPRLMQLLRDFPLGTLGQVCAGLRGSLPREGGLTMIAGRDFVVLSDDYDGLPTSAMHLFRWLARHNRVFWFNTIGRFPRWTRADAGKVLRTVGAWVRPRRPDSQSKTFREDGIQVVSPLMIPWFKVWGRRFNRRSLLRKYRHLCYRHRLNDPIVVTTFPHAVDFVKAVPAALKIYYCVDNFLHYPGINPGDWAVMEAELFQTIDGLIVTSRNLADKRANGCPLLHLPHGVDFDHFAGGAEPKEIVPTLERLPRPVVGFFGLLGPWFDRELVLHLSEVFPEVSFVLIGRADIDLVWITGRPNVHHLEFVPYEKLPAYARYFDVGLIPYVLTPFTRAINPLKLLEYFALGLPAVATRLPELETVAGPVRLALTRPEFVEGLRAALNNRSQQQAQEALQIAKRNTWEARVLQLGTFLEQVATGEKACVR